ncbi:toast rack family protein [Alkalihalobacillus sp. AL-G]|uniref:toast rack family protein n=1 Tax=Alkalihalobacillus sp. AL-G TaxID=2926399 RepID=UPI00272A17A8|nr:toast rack family protein [Alkalihalobacillus sp. AL-G]WLD94190.1 toast rack family protein [Alkalihalobacillus sp. AL-G]
MLIKEKTSKKHVIEKNDEKELDVTVEMGIGKLKLSGRSEQIMEGTFKYRGDELEPTMDYAKEGEKGTLVISQKSVSKWGQFFSAKQDWDFSLNNQLPLSLCIEIGTGKSELDLSDLNLQKLSIDAGVGESVIDLTGEWSTSFKAEMNTGVGKTKIILPKKVGARLTLSKGVGKINADYFMMVGDAYQNQAYDDADVKIDINLNVGVGEVILEQV